MLIKKLNFDDDTLAVLKAMSWSDDGTLGTITGGQLERKLYEKVNKALDAMGGKWNKKQGGHVFATDPRPQVEGFLESGSLVVERDGFFETPEPLVKRMVQEAPIKTGMNVLEPSAGLGAIVGQVLPFGGYMMCVEKNKERAAAVTKKFGVTCIDIDFLELDPENGANFDRVFMNPPFEESQDIFHVQHAYRFLKDGGFLVAIMGEGAFLRSDKWATRFRSWLEKVGGTSERLPPGTFKESGTGVNSRIVAIEK